MSRKTYHSKSHGVYRQRWRTESYRKRIWVLEVPAAVASTIIPQIMMSLKQRH